MTELATAIQNAGQISSWTVAAGPNTSTLPSNALLTGRQRSAEYTLRRNGDSLVVTSGLPAPLWLNESLDQIQDVLHLRDNWNSYGALSISIDAAYAALEILAEIAPLGAPTPSIVPTVDRGIQLEWHEDGIDLEIEVLSRSRAVVYFADPSSAEEWENDLDTKLVEVRRCLERLSR